jgi:hypothetical protein
MKPNSGEKRKPSRFTQGKYKLNNPSKYIGNPDNITYRSSWELRVHTFLDNNPNILKWASEEIPIKYLHPADNKIHTYWPDYYVEYVNSKSMLIREIIEVKPSKDGKISKSKNPRTKAIETMTYVTNMAKWEHAKKFCEAHKLQFRILTEKELFK